MPRAFKTITARLTVFFVGGAICVGVSHEPLTRPVHDSFSKTQASLILFLHLKSWFPMMSPSEYLRARSGPQLNGVAEDEADRVI